MKTGIGTVIIIMNLVIPMIVIGQSQINHKYQAEELLEDFAILKVELKRLHSGLYRYSVESTMDSVFLSIEQKLNKPMTAIEFFRKVKPLVKYIANGHTDIMPSIDYHRSLINELPRFPFIVDKTQKGLKVLMNKSNNSDIQDGDVIVSINNISANEVYQNLVDNTTRDGYSLTLPEIKVATNYSGY